MDAETLFNAAGPPRHSAANTVFRTYKHSAVVDVETPGQHRNDRIVEVAVVVVDRKGRIRDEWETLINPWGVAHRRRRQPHTWAVHHPCGKGAKFP